MIRTNFRQHATRSTESGFALLMSLIVVGVIVSVGITVLELSIIQVQLASNAQDSEAAFYAANAGIECGQYVRRQNAEDMENGDVNLVIASCFNQVLDGSGASPEITIDTPNPPVVSNPAHGEAYVYNYEFTWGVGNNLCTEITTLVASSSDDSFEVTNVDDVVPGYPSGSTLTCSSDERCSVLSVRGYNKPCNELTTIGTVQREVVLEL